METKLDEMFYKTHVLRFEIHWSRFESHISEVLLALFFLCVKCCVFG